MDANKSRLADMDAKLEEFIKQCNERCPFGSRDDRKRRAQQLMDYFAKSGKEYNGAMICNWLDAEHPPPLLNDNWLGFKWVAFRGMDSLCVVALKDDLVELEHYLMQFKKKDMATSVIWNALVNEVEGIEDRFFQGSWTKLLSVVATISGISEISRYPPGGAENSCKFLMKEMKSDATFTFDKTMQTAISAFQLLLCRKLKAHEIRVFAWKKGDMGEELQLWRDNPDLDEVLASIRVPDNGDADTFTPKKGIEFRPPADVIFQEVGWRRYFREGQGDGLSRLSRKRKASEKATHPKEGRERRKKKSGSKATKETGDALDNDALQKMKYVRELFVAALEKERLKSYLQLH